jgi:hypothetical protein
LRAYVDVLEKGSYADPEHGNAVLPRGYRAQHEPSRSVGGCAVIAGVDTHTRIGNRHAVDGVSYHSAHRLREGLRKWEYSQRHERQRSSEKIPNTCSHTTPLICWLAAL